MTRAAIVFISATLLLSACSSGGESEDAAFTSAPVVTDAQGNLVPTLPASGPMSAPLGPPDQVGIIDCDDDITIPVAGDGLPGRIDAWFIVPGVQAGQVGDGGSHPEGYRYLSVPTPMTIRAAVDPDRATPRGELSTLQPQPDATGEIANRTFTDGAVLDLLVSLDLTQVETLLIPLDGNQTYGGWSTPVVLMEHPEGGISVLSSCGGALEADLRRALAAARRAGVTGSSADIITALSAAELRQLAAE